MEKWGHLSWGPVNLELKGLKIIPFSRGEFLKQNCPVSTCALTNDRKKKESADLILFKVSKSFNKNFICKFYRIFQKKIKRKL